MPPCLLWVHESSDWLSLFSPPFIPINCTVAITQGGAIQLANNGTDGVQGLPTLTMTNAAAAHPGATILQYAQTSDGQQILVPSNQVVVQGEWDFIIGYSIYANRNEVGNIWLYFYMQLFCLLLTL